MAAPWMKEPICASFKSADTGDGTIDKLKLQQMLQASNGSFWTQPRIDKLFSGVPAQENGRVDFKAFLDWIFSDENRLAGPNTAAMDEVLSCVANVATPPRHAPPGEIVKEAGAKPSGSPGEIIGVTGTHKQNKLADGVDLFTVKDEKAFTFKYSVFNGKLATLFFTLDLTKGTNMGCADWENPQKITKEIGALDKEDIGVVTRLDPSAAASLKLGFSWKYKPLNKEQIRLEFREHDEEIVKHGERMREKKIFASELQSAEAIAAACRAAGESFLDVEFAPNDEALFADPKDSTHPPVIWKRAKDFLTPPITVFQGGISPNDIKQGALGDCWFLAALAALAEYPDTVSRLFMSLDYSEEGVYEITCFKDGARTSVILDDYFPCNPISGKPCYSKAAGSELWVMLLEKAWAKIHGHYEQIESGAPFRGIMDLCGGTGAGYPLSHPLSQAAIKSGMLFDNLRLADEKGYLMCAGTPGHDNLTKKANGKLPTGGIVPGHAYTLLGAKQYGDTKLVRLRNPWGAFEWEGDWSDRSPCWTEEMKQAFKPALSESDGTFWMSDVDFFQEFEDVHICYFDARTGKEPFEHREKLPLKGAPICTRVVQFEVEFETPAFVTLCQRDKKIEGALPYVDLSFAVYKIGVSGLPEKAIMKSKCWPVREIVETTNVIEDNKWVAKKLSVGKYVCFVYNPTKVSDRTVTLVIQLDRHERGKNQVLDTYFDLTPEVRMAAALATAKAAPPQKFGPLETKGAFLAHHGYAYAVRNPGVKAIKVTFDFSGSKGYMMEGRKEGEMQAELLCPPGGPFQLVGEFVPVTTGATFNVAGKMAYC